MGICSIINPMHMCKRGYSSHVCMCVCHRFICLSVNHCCPSVVHANGINTILRGFNSWISLIVLCSKVMRLFTSSISITIQHNHHYTNLTFICESRWLREAIQPELKTFLSLHRWTWTIHGQSTDTAGNGTI